MDIDTGLKPYRPWSSRDYAALAVLVALAALLFCTGLSLRSLWGSEGRWAVIAREMMRGGNYFLPTINGSVYFDKPLLSYWAIVPFSLFSGVTEVSARLPGALAGIGTVALVFTMGRGLFGYVPGFIAGLLLMTTVMFGFWSRTASAEILNLVAIWSMLWVLPKGDEKRSFARYLLFYLIGAAASFCKGPLALAVALAAVFALSCADLFLDARQAGVRGIRGRVVHRFQWILSLKGILAALCG
ncbi:MAG TPA: glycosyltransferase family 39 protein, partial [Syntrophorhabdaceae bacterium]|nr:glycosyltransferase family 39 protein [Syntrophorhabdaceae bacterium]